MICCFYHRSGICNPPNGVSCASLNRRHLEPWEDWHHFSAAMAEQGKVAMCQRQMVCVLGKNENYPLHCLHHPLLQMQEDPIVVGDAEG